MNPAMAPRGSSQPSPLPPSLFPAPTPLHSHCSLQAVPEEKEKRRLDQLERKKETQRLLEEEDSKLKGGKAPRVATSSKVTRAQIEDTLRRDHQLRETPDAGGAASRSGTALLPTAEAAGLASISPLLVPREALSGAGWVGWSPPGRPGCEYRQPLGLCRPPPPGTEKAKSHLEVPLEENVNRRVLEEGSVEARTIEDAIAVLRLTQGPLTRMSTPSVAEEAADRHPERRLRAAFTAFEEAQLPRLKQENPNMRLSQLKQLLKKEWLRSPDNPMNQRAVPFNAPK
ncbi:hypothetical protein P7K49_033610 [Saguinus oedipus]|uniref:Coiled-coil domain-containing protein n=1 Tax=Saguinus oedipus TaxID=9490 RepID=A0ABQ9TSD0_SAGOE|nr:hypothetical protein P7K49_033610 [Saguinus oedipus]